METSQPLAPGESARFVVTGSDPGVDVYNFSLATVAMTFDGKGVRGDSTLGPRHGHESRLTDGTVLTLRNVSTEPAVIRFAVAGHGDVGIRREPAER